MSCRRFELLPHSPDSLEALDVQRFETADAGAVSLEIGFIRNRLIPGNCSFSFTRTCSIDRIVEYFNYHVGFCDQTHPVSFSSTSQELKQSTLWKQSGIS